MNTPSTSSTPLETDWSPERKIVGAAIATLIVAAIDIAFPQIDLPPGVEGAIAVITGYLIPNR